jgi:hypothetical protein
MTPKQLGIFIPILFRELPRAKRNSSTARLLHVSAVSGVGAHPGHLTQRDWQFLLILEIRGISATSIQHHYRCWHLYMRVVVINYDPHFRNYIYIAHQCKCLSQAHTSFEAPIWFRSSYLSPICVSTFKLCSRLYK